MKHQRRRRIGRAYLRLIHCFTLLIGANAHSRAGRLQLMMRYPAEP
jgi:hypothetical protein